MKLKAKLCIVAVSAVLLILVGVVYFLKNTSEMVTTLKNVEINDYTYSYCTTDVPASQCGPYDVTMTLSNGKSATYKAAGFSNGDGTTYDQIYHKITEAKERKARVTLTVNDKGEITSIQ